MFLHTLLGIAQVKRMLGVRSRFDCFEELNEWTLRSRTAPIKEQVPEMNRDQKYKKQQKLTRFPLKGVLGGERGPQD